MPKSLLYIPGLAMPEAGARALAPQAFKAKVARLFGERQASIRDAVPDGYMVEMVDTLIAKGAQPVDCRRMLRWVDVSGLAPPPPPDLPVRATQPSGGGMAKAMRRLGPRAEGVLSRQPGENPSEPIDLVVHGRESAPCTGAEYMAQPLPSKPAGQNAELPTLAKGDTLYIVGHSNPNGTALTYKFAAPGHPDWDQYVHPDGCKAKWHNQKRHVDPTTLAALLVDEGLPPGIQFDIVVVACFSGGLASDGLQTVQCFSQRLAGALSARGYRCRVYGARGLTSSAEENGRREVKVAGKLALVDKEVRLRNGDTTTKKQLTVLPQSSEVLPDAGGKPFYKRFFRVFG